MRWVYSDGGRADAGFRGTAGDCAARAIAIATALPYRLVYDRIAALAPETQVSGRQSSPRLGVWRATIDRLMADLGWIWTPTMRIGSGCCVHLRSEDLPSGRLVARVSRHYVAVIDGIAYDTHDPTRGGQRCVYGYWTEPQ